MLLRAVKERGGGRGGGKGGTSREVVPYIILKENDICRNMRVRARSPPPTPASARSADGAGECVSTVTVFNLSPESSPRLFAFAFKAFS